MKNTHLLTTTAWLAQACDDGPGFVAAVVLDLARMAKRHQRLCERACNEPQKDIDVFGYGHLDRWIANSEHKMRTRFAHLKRPEALLSFQHDPRGGTVFLVSVGAGDTTQRDRYYL